MTAKDWLSAVAAVTFTVGLSLLALGLAQGKPWQAAHWRQTHGTITFFGSNGPYETNTGSQYNVIVGYDYVVNHVTYPGDSFNIDQLNESRPELANETRFQELGRKYPVGTPVTVYYDADAVNRSVLEDNIGTAGSVLWVGAGLCAVGAIAEIIFVTLRRGNVL